jgi:DNA-binding transcriptional LysR family regulator
VLFAPIYLVPLIAQFMERYPKIEVELKLSDSFVDILAEGLDLAVRIGELSDSSLKARRLGELRRVVFGAPAYFDKYGRPEKPDDLSAHQCVIRTTDRVPAAWQFRVGKRLETVRVNGRFAADSTAAIQSSVVCGLGIGNAPLWQIRGAGGSRRGRDRPGGVRDSACSHPRRVAGNQAAARENAALRRPSGRAS